jgi:ADP-ribose pyrophosphatase
MATIYTGRIFRLDQDTVHFPDGSTGVQDILRHPGASAVLPCLDPLTDRDPRVILIRQFRHAAAGPLWEIPAGRRDGHEDPETTARRELAEETGFRAKRFTKLTQLLTTPGFTDEVIHLYTAHDLTTGASAREVDEFLEVRPLRWSEVGRMVRNGEIYDAKTVAALTWVQCFVREATSTRP